MLDVRLQVSLFNGKRDNVPCPFAWTWGEAASELSRHRERDDKDGPLWSPTRFSKPHRGGEHAVEISALVLDFDGGHGWEDFLTFWDSKGLAYAVHTSHSHTSAIPKWRAVFPFAAPCPADPDRDEWWKAIWAVLVDDLSGGVLQERDDLAVDPVSDRARMYFLPSCPLGAERFADCADGKALDWRSYEPAALELIRARKEAAVRPIDAAVKSQSSPGSGRPGDDFNARADWADILEPKGWRENGRCGKMTLWTRPEKKVVRGQHSARTGPGLVGDRFVNWSTSVPEFPVHRAFDKFGAYARLYHGGDVAAATRDLSAKGYGAAPLGISNESPPIGAPPGRKESYDRKVPKAVAQESEEGESWDPSEALPPEMVGRVKWEPKPEGQYSDPEMRRLRKFSLGDTGNAERMVQWFGADLRYVAATGWHVWDKGRWRKGEEGEVAVRRVARRVARRVLEAAYAEKDDEQTKRLTALSGKLQESRAISAMIKEAASFAQIEAHLTDFDRDPLLFGVLNGTLDFRTGQLRPPNPGDMITMRAGTKFEEVECPRFLTFVEEIMLGREDLMQFLMLSLGYSLTGLMNPATVWFLIGTGANGKSLLTGLTQRIAGDYSTTLMPDSIMVRKTDQIPADIAKLQGKRMVVVPEVDEGRQLNMSLLKALSSNEENITARFLNANYVDFRSTSKLWLTGNEKPRIRNFDKALRRRLRVVPFEYAVPDEKRDERLGEKLWDEAPGILWLIAAATREFLANRALPTIQAVEEATDEYQRETDYVGQFLDDECDLGDSSWRTAKKTIKERYLAWSKSNGLPALKRNTFYDRLRAAGIKDAPTMTHGEAPFMGVRLREQTND